MGSQGERIGEHRNLETFFKNCTAARFWGHTQINEGDRFVVQADLANWNYKSVVECLGQQSQVATLYWRTGMICATHHSKFLNNGFAEIRNNSIFINGRVIQDAHHEGIEKLRFDFYRNAIWGPRIGSHEINIINVPKPERRLEKIYSISTSKDSFEEGEKISATFGTKNVSSGTRLWWSFSGKGIDASDFSDSNTNFTGSFVLDHSKNRSIQYNLKRDFLTEGDEKISLSLYEDEAHRRKVASAEFVVRDTSLSPPKPPKPPEVPKVHLAGFLNGIKWPREVEWKYSTSPDPNGQYLSITHRHAGGPTRYHFNWDAINQRRIGYGNINEYLDDLGAELRITPPIELSLMA